MVIIAQMSPLKSLSLLVLAAGLLSGCGPRITLQKRDALIWKCTDGSDPHRLDACHFLYGPNYGISQFDDPLEAKYWEFRAKVRQLVGWVHAFDAR
jgi:hypothetical protein